MWFRILVAFFVFLLCGSASQAVAADGDSLLLMNSRSSRVGLNTYTFQNNLLGQYSFSAQNQLRYHLHNDWIYNSSLENDRFVRQNYLANAQQLLDFKPQWQWGQELFHSQNQANAISISSYRQLVSYRQQYDSLVDMRYTVTAGLRRDARNQISDLGPEWGGRLQAILLSGEDGEAGALQFSRLQAHLGPRRYVQTAAAAFYERQITPYSNIWAQAAYASITSEDYQAGNIQQIKSDTLSANVRFSYQIAPGLALRSDNAAQLPRRAFRYRPNEGNEPVQQNVGYHQIELNTLQELSYQRKKLKASLQFLFLERNRSYELDNNLALNGSALNQLAARERIKDITEKTTGWQLAADYKLSRQHTLTLQTRAQLLRLDTPSDENDQDRDEVLYVGKLQLTSRWDRTFRTWVAIGSEQRQMVYIKASQSAENFTDRSFRYEPGFSWAPGRFSWQSQYQIWATYQVRDAANEQLKNRSNRLLYQQHQARFEITPLLNTSLLYSRRETRLSLLNWQNFTESPLDTTISNDFTFFLEKRAKNNLGRIRLGYRYFEQRLQNRSGISYPDKPPVTAYVRQITRQHGPEMQLAYNKENRFEAGVTVWLQRLHTFYDYKTDDSSYFGPTRTQEELNHQRRHFYPTFEVNFSWLLTGKD